MRRKLEHTCQLLPVPFICKAFLPELAEDSRTWSWEVTCMHAQKHRLGFLSPPKGMGCLISPAHSPVSASVPFSLFSVIAFHLSPSSRCLFPSPLPVCLPHLSLGSWRGWSFLSALQYISLGDGDTRRILIRAKQCCIITPIVSEDLTVNEEFQACSSTALLETVFTREPLVRILAGKQEESEKLPIEAFYADLIVFEA